jgi:hypothetical protein
MRYEHTPAKFEVIYLLKEHSELFRDIRAPWENTMAEHVQQYLNGERSGIISAQHRLDHGETTLRFIDEPSAKAFIARFISVQKAA